jgi:hypothetical protein
MARHGFKTCSSTASTDKNKGCNYHVHKYTLDTQNRIARDAACLGYVAGHYDPLNTKKVCEKTTSDWSKCEQGDLSGKWGKMSRDVFTKKALKADKPSNELHNLNVFTRGKDGDEGAFSRALVFHSPADNGGEAWFCVTLGNSCTAIPKDKNRDIGPDNLVDYFDKNCAIEKTSLLFVWEGSGKKYNMYAGEEPGEKNTRLIPGRKTRIPSIYNLKYQPRTAPPPPNTLPTTIAADDAVMSSVFFGFTTLALITFF